MSRWRIAVILFLLAAPALILVVLGSYLLWIEGLGFMVWWPMAAAMASGYFLAWYWLRNRQLLNGPRVEAPGHWSGVDLQAWKLVEQRAAGAGTLEPAKFVDVHFYLDTAQVMAQELAQIYHPGTPDPFGPVTLPEILTVVELAAHDLALLLEQYVPASHLVTISHFRQAQQAIGWYQKANNLWWLIGAFFNPVETGARYATSRLSLSTSWSKLQENLVQWFFVAYVHELGRYLIDLESGRLKVGAKRYRELTTALDENSAAAPGATRASPLTIAVVGQTKAGKSSLINALLGEQRAAADVIPLTDEVTRYELRKQDGPPLTLVDTPGYAHTGLSKAQRAAAFRAILEADLVLIVLHARTPARQPDIDALTDLARWFGEQPGRKAPPLLGVLTHIDLLSPAMEWQPPYNWNEPSRPKEKQISQALQTVHDQFQESLAACVPVCTEPSRVYGVQEHLVPAIVRLLPEARAVNLVRVLHAEADGQKVQKILQQLLAAGKMAFRLLGERGSALEATLPPSQSQVH